MRGITLYVNGRLANEPEFFGGSESSFAFSYLTGYLNVDYVDELGRDVIATDRRSLDWEDPATTDLRTALSQLVQRVAVEWRQKRDALRQDRTQKALGTDVESWVDSIRSPEQPKVRAAVEAVNSEKLDLSPDQRAEILGEIHQIAPHSAEYVWRHLHPELQSATKTYYDQGDYYQAVQEGIKRYVTLCRDRAKTSEAEAMRVVTAAFGKNASLAVFAPFAEAEMFSQTTLENIEEGQKHLSMGLVAGFRNPLAHEEVAALERSGGFTNFDCLDALGILSHLTRRLVGSRKR